MLKRAAFAIVMLLACGFMPTPVWAATDEVTLAWDPNSESDLAGYQLYIQEEPHDSGYRLLATIPLADIDALAPSYTVFDLEADTQYRFVITAYNRDGDESGVSNSVCVENGGLCSVYYSTGSASGCFLATLPLQ
jgi:hypothetical protein